MPEEFDPFAGTAEEQAAEEKAREERAAKRAEGKSPSTKFPITVRDGKAMISEYAEHGDPESRWYQGPVRVKRKIVNHNKRAELYLLQKFPYCKVQKCEITGFSSKGFAFKRDYLGFIDFFAHLVDGESIAVQVTTMNGKSSHIVKMSKIKECWEWVRAKRRVLLLCYDQPKGPGTPYEPHEFWITEETLAACYKRRQARMPKK